jgi:hypothetical protein
MNSTGVAFHVLITESSSSSAHRAGGGGRLTVGYYRFLARGLRWPLFPGVGLPRGVAQESRMKEQRLARLVVQLHESQPYRLRSYAPAAMTEPHCGP